MLALLKILLIGFQTLLLTQAQFNSSTSRYDVAVTCHSNVSKHCSAQTTLRPIVERVFSRRKRFVLMPKGGALKFTAALSKRLLAMYPRGFSLVIEAAVYYPGVSSRIDLIPKRFRPPTTTTPKPVGPTQPLFVYIPGSLLRYKAKPATKPPKVQRIDSEPVQWIDTPPHRPYNKYSDPQQWLQYEKYGNAGNAYEQKYAWTPNKAAKYKYSHQSSATTRPKWTRWTTTTQLPKQWWQSSSQKSYNEWPRREQSRFKRESFESASADADVDAELLRYQAMDFPDLDPYEESWRHFHAHRDRRQLFHAFEGFSKILGFDMKSCILRAICESKSFLLPTGYSMLHDMLRVVLTVPTMTGLTDDYSRIVQSEADTCQHELQQKCSISLLSWFLNSDNAKFNL